MYTMPLVSRAKMVPTPAAHAHAECQRGHGAGTAIESGRVRALRRPARRHAARGTGMEETEHDEPAEALGERSRAAEERARAVIRVALVVLEAKHIDVGAGPHVLAIGVLAGRRAGQDRVACSVFTFLAVLSNAPLLGLQDFLRTTSRLSASRGERARPHGIERQRAPPQHSRSEQAQPADTSTTSTRLRLYSQWRRGLCTRGPPSPPGPGPRLQQVQRMRARNAAAWCQSKVAILGARPQAYIRGLLVQLPCQVGRVQLKGMVKVACLHLSDTPRLGPTEAYSRKSLTGTGRRPRLYFYHS